MISVPNAISYPDVEEGVLRGQVYGKFHEWEIKTEDHWPDHLAILMGYKGFNGLIKKPTEKKKQILRALISPHGYTIYKMLLARKK